MNNLKEVSEQLNGSERKTLAANVTAMHQEIVVNVPRSVIPEVVFVEHFLDYFRSNTISDTTSALGLKWVELARSPYNYVDVINTEGTVIYTVPPMMLNAEIAGSDLAKTNFEKIVSTYKLKNNVLAASAQNYINTQLSSVNTKLVNSRIDDITLQWRAIFNMYNKPNQQQAILPTKDTSMDGLIDYD